MRRTTRHQAGGTDRDARRADGRADAGQVAVEFLGTIGYLVLAALAAVQLLFAVATVQGVSVAARAAARTVSQGNGSAPVAARAAVPDWLADDLRVQVTGGGPDRGVRVSAPITVVLPGITGPTVTRQAWFPAERGRGPWR